MVADGLTVNTSIVLTSILMIAFALIFAGISSTFIKFAGTADVRSYYDILLSLARAVTTQKVARRVYTTVYTHARTVLFINWKFVHERTLLVGFRCVEYEKARSSALSRNADDDDDDDDDNDDDGVTLDDRTVLG